MPHPLSLREWLPLGTVAEALATNRAERRHYLDLL
jgi:hypothetical protein